MPLPPARDDQGEVIPLSEDELYEHWAKTFLMDRAGGWSPDSAPGQNAIKEFEAFVRETQARAIDAFRVEHLDVGDNAYLHAVDRAEAIRNGHLDLSGNRLVQ